MSYLQDYIYYSSGNEVPEEYTYWSALSILGQLLGNKVWIEHGDYYRFNPQIYVALVGEAGSGKNSGLSVNMDIMINNFSDYHVSASIQSREDIAYVMSEETPTSVKTWKDAKGIIHEYRPFYILNNELASFLSVDKLRMVEFLTEIYDGKRFSTGFKKDRKDNPDRKQWFNNPHVSLLAGAVPSWFMGSLKMDLFSGGLGRRMIIVNSARAKVIPEPTKPHGHEACMSRIIEHLKQAEKFTGGVAMSDAAKKWWDPWYRKHKEKKTIDPILYQFDATKPMQVKKVALLLHMTEYPFKPQISADALQAADELLTTLEPNIIKLTSGIGRNELAGVGAQLIDFIERTGGMQTEVNVLKYFRRYASSPEFLEIVNSYINTGELVVEARMKDGIQRMFYFTPAGHAEFRKLGEQPKT